MRYQVTIGDPTSALSFVLHGIEAETPEAACAQAREWLAELADFIVEQAPERPACEIRSSPHAVRIADVGADEWPDPEPDDDEWEDEDDDEDEDEGPDDYEDTDAPDED